MSSAENSIKTPGRRATSMPLLIGVVIFGAVAYFAVPMATQYVMFLQEQAKANEINAKARIVKDVSEGEVEAPTEPRPMKQPLEAGGGGGGAGRAAPDPEAMFAGRDKDGNGKLEGDEISERMQTRVAEIDTDKDGAISKEEFLASIQRRQSAAATPSETATGPAAATKDSTSESAPKP